MVDRNGCAPPPECPCDGPWLNHGEYVSCVAKSVARLNGAGAELAYASSALAVRRMLDEAGGFAIANLLRDLGAGVAFETAFARRMNRPLAAFVP